MIQAARAKLAMQSYYFCPPYWHLLEQRVTNYSSASLQHKWQTTKQQLQTAPRSLIVTVSSVEVGNARDTHDWGVNTA